MNDSSHGHPCTTKFREIEILAQNPDVKDGNRNLLTRVVSIPNEHLEPGPRSGRFTVVDYDATREKSYSAKDLQKKHYKPKAGSRGFHAQNVFGTASATLFAFEQALGRNLDWGLKSGSHQLTIYPHAALRRRAAFSVRDECLKFGYFSNGKAKGWRDHTFLCLSHDAIVHETTHAILNGLRSQFTRPSGPDQAAFHEGYADCIALLSAMCSANVIEAALRKTFKPDRSGLVSKKTVLSFISKAMDGKANNFLTELAAQLGDHDHGERHGGLRTSLSQEADESLYETMRKRGPHRFGELLVMCVLRSFLRVCERRLLEKLKRTGGGTKKLPPWWLYDEGAKAAKHMMYLLIRAIDYLPPVHVTFRSFLTALLTADRELVPQDTYGYRTTLLEIFAAHGIEPLTTKDDEGCWSPDKAGAGNLHFSGGNIAAMRWDRESMFEFIWKHQRALGLQRETYTHVKSVRPVWRVGPDGFILRETVAEYYQLIQGVTLGELRTLSKIKTPRFLKGSRDTSSPLFDLVGGGALVFDEFGNLKYHIYEPVAGRDQTARLQSMWEDGVRLADRDPDRPFRIA